MIRILMVDDSRITLKKMVKAMGERDGHNVTTAMNGVEACDLVRSSDQPFDLIVTDLHMPEMDGFQLIAELVSQGVTAPIVVCSADQQSSTADKVIELGAKEILNKPSLYKEGAIDSLIEKYVHRKAS